MKTSFLILIVLPFAFTCKEIDRRNTTADLNAADTLQYEAIDVPAGLRMSCAGVSSTQDVFVTISFDDNTKLNSDPTGIALYNPDGSRAFPVNVDIDSLSSEITSIRLQYSPVNDMNLFQQTGLRGDLLANYALAFDGADGTMLSERIELRANPNQHAGAIQRHGLSGTTSPLVIDMHDLEDDPFTEVDDRARMNGEIHGNEILNNGLWVKLISYVKSDSMYVTLRMVNQTQEPILILTNKISVSTSTETFAEAKYHSDSVIVQNSGRISLPLVFKAPSASQIQLDLSSIISPTRKFFVAPFTLRKIAVRDAGHRH